MKLRLSPFASCTVFTAAFCATQLVAQTDPSKPSASASAPATAATTPAQAPNASTPAKPATTTQAADNAPSLSSKPTPAGAPAAATAQTAPGAATVAQAPAAGANPAASAPHPNIKLASHEAKDHVARKFIGQHVRSRDGSDIGTVDDFLVDTQTGKVDFAVVASGGLAGLGEKRHLVPLPALQPAGESGDFRIDVTEERWKTLATVDEDDLASTPFTMSDAQYRQIARNFEHRTEAQPESGFYTASLTRRFVRATELAGRDVTTGANRLGKIDDLVIDLGTQAAQALVAPEHDFTHLREKLVVPFNELAIGGGGKHPRVTTLLTQADFQQLHGANSMPGSASASPAAAPAPAPAAPQTNQVAANPSKPSQAKTPQAPAAKSEAAPASKNTPAVASTATRPSATHALNEEPNSTIDRGAVAKAEVAAKEKAGASKPGQTQNKAASTQDQTGRVAKSGQTPAGKDENLTPTGKTSADSIPAGTNPALIATARAVRKALDDDPALAHADIRVTPEEGKIVLRGRVSDQKTKTALIEAATHEIKGWKFDDQISVDTDDTK